MKFVFCLASQRDNQNVTASDNVWEYIYLTNYFCTVFQDFRSEIQSPKMKFHILNTIRDLFSIIMKHFRIDAGRLFGVFIYKKIIYFKSMVHID